MMSIRYKGKYNYSERKWCVGKTLQWRHNERDASEITSLTIVYSTVYSGKDERKHQGEFTGDRWMPRTKGQ